MGGGRCDDEEQPKRKNAGAEMDGWESFCILVGRVYVESTRNIYSDLT